jgi:hypothetical protein
MWTLVESFADARGAVSGGTVASMIHLMENEAMSELQAVGANPYYLAPRDAK